MNALTRGGLSASCLVVGALSSVAACDDEGSDRGAAGAAGTAAGSAGRVSGSSGNAAAGSGGNGAAGSAGSAGSANAGAAGGETSGGSGGAGGSGIAGAAGASAGTAGAGGAGETCADPKEIAAFVDQPLHLTKACSPYHVAAPSVVRSGAFVIDAGVTITFAPGADLRVGAGPAAGAALTANGSEAAPIVFGPDQAGASKGSWRGLWLEASATGPASAELHHVRIAGAGAVPEGTDAPVAALIAEGPALLDHVSIAGSKGSGLSVGAALREGSQALSFSDVDERLVDLPFTFVASLPAISSGTGNAKAAIGVQTGAPVTGTWRSQPVPFHLAFSQTIGDGPAGESTVVTIEKNTLLFAGDVGLSIGATEGQLGTGDLVAKDVVFDALEPAKPWAGITIVAQYTNKTILEGGRISRGFGKQALVTNIPGTTPTAYASHYTALFIGQSTSNKLWAKVQGVTIQDVGAVPPPAPQTADVSVPTCIAVRGIPCDAPAPKYGASGNTLSCATPVLDYDGCVGP